MNIKTVEEECKDTSIGAIEDEIEMFFGSKAERFVFQDKYFYLKGTDICLSGDNLITKKQMWRRIHHRRKTPQNIENDKIFSSYIILPRIRNDYRSNVNNVRNSTYGYNDNPFLFFKALRTMYICEFDKSKASKPLDYVEKAIIQTNLFWKLFGNGEEGYAECERAFCVSGILELCEDDKYKEFLCEKILEEEGWSFYETLLDELRILRTVQMKKRFTELKNVENP